MRHDIDREAQVVRYQRQQVARVLKWVGRERRVFVTEVRVVARGVLRQDRADLAAGGRAGETVDEQQHTPLGTWREQRAPGLEALERLEHVLRLRAVA